MSYPVEQIGVVIVGAGPIGLLNAIGLLHNNPNRKIVLLEKYAQYQRNHVLRVDYHHVLKFMKASGATHDPVLKDLVKQLKKNPQIKITQLESLLKERALALGADIKQQAITDVQQEVLDVYTNASLVIGADGAHSTVSRQLFGEENVEKRPLDYLLQLRIEIPGDVRKIDQEDLLEYMQAYGVIAQEFRGSKRDGKTPLTLQLFISKEHFQALQPHAPSKTPIKPFDDTDAVDKIPVELLQQIKGYLGLRLRHYTAPDANFPLNAVTVSVNEAPATRAKCVVKSLSNVRPKHAILVGDAALGLSYLKGINAGIINTAMLHRAICSKDRMRYSELRAYEGWFNDFADKKIKEVISYNKFIIKTARAVMQRLYNVLSPNAFLAPEEAERSVDLYRVYQHDCNVRGVKERWHPYPHRLDDVHAVVKFLTPLPLKWLKKTRHFIEDTIKPYKSAYHRKRDVIQPLRALYHLLTGVTQLFIALPIFFTRLAFALLDRGAWRLKQSNIKGYVFTALARLADGLSHLSLGLILAATAVLMPIRLLWRSALGIFMKAPAIEEQKQIQQLITKGHAKAAGGHEENALAIDVHRKFLKAANRGQRTTIDQGKEAIVFHRCQRLGTGYSAYFNLFSPMPNKPVVVNNSPATELLPPV